MATKKSDLIIPEILEDAVAGELQGLDPFEGVGSAAVVVNGSLDENTIEAAKGGEAIKIPYFDHMGELEKVAEDVALTPTKLTMSSETATLEHYGKAWERTEWSQMAAQYADPDAEAARQLAGGVRRAMAKELITKAGSVATTMQVTSDGATVTYDNLVDLQMKFGDEQKNVAGWMMHSKVAGDLLKLKDSDGRPLFVDVNDDGTVARVLGKPVIVSDLCAQTFPTISSTGTSPPAVTVTGRAMGYDPIALKIDIVVGGALATATFRYSLDGGTTWSATVATAASVLLGTTGLTATFAAGTYNADNEYTGVARYETNLVKRASLVVWFQGRPRVLNDQDVLKDNKIAALHAYFVAHCWKRLRGGTKPGVARLRTQ